MAPAIANGVESEVKSLRQNGEMQLDSFRSAVIDELCFLRREVNILRRGGWQVRVGAFLEDRESEEVDLAVLRERFMAQLDLNGGQRSSALSMSAYEDNGTDEVKVQEDAGRSGLSKLPSKEVTVIPAPAIDVTVDPDTPIPSVEGPAQATSTWKPSYLRNLAPLERFGDIPSATSMATFSWDFLQATFHGTEHSPGLYYVPKSAGLSILPTRTFYAINCTYEPHLPIAPGCHGAKLTAFFNNIDPEDGGEAAYEHVPLFISASQWGDKQRKGNEYIYFGTYTQTRWSDKLDHDTLTKHVPDNVKFHWAEELADPARPEWVTKALMKHFYPIPEYEGVLSKNALEGANADEKMDAEKKFEKDVKEYIIDLERWETRTRRRVGQLTKAKILEAFGNADADTVPGLRLWWEYLECVEWDIDFYKMLCKLQEKAKMRR